MMVLKIPCFGKRKTRKVFQIILVSTIPSVYIDFYAVTIHPREAIRNLKAGHGNGLPADLYPL